jgi:hypothetical protein
VIVLVGFFGWILLWWVSVGGLMDTGYWNRSDELKNE